MIFDDPIHVQRPEVPAMGPSSFLDEAHPGPAPACPEEVVGAQMTPADSLARAIIDAARDEAGAVPLTELLLLRETKNLAGCVSEVEVQTAAGHLSLGDGTQSAFIQMLTVAEAIVRCIDEEHEEAEAAQRNLTLYNAVEHAREIRSALKLPGFEVGQVWRLVDTREITIQYVLDGRVTARVTREAAGGLFESASPVLEYRVDGTLLDQSVDPQPHTIFHCTPIALLSVLTEQGRVPPAAVKARDPGLAKTLENLAGAEVDREARIGPDSCGQGSVAAGLTPPPE